jgi:serine/threonine-protein kinase
MTDDPRVQQLLEKLLDSHATPEEVCGSCPELLSMVRDRLRRVHRLQADLNAFFPPPDAAPPPPACTALPQVAGYDLEAVLGRGGMGIVYQARHLRLNRRVALKMVLGGAYAGAHDVARFRREAEAVAGLRHENIVRVHDAGEHDGQPYFTMEYVEGGGLAQKLHGTPQPARQAAALVATLAGAVQVAHHRLPRAAKAEGAGISARGVGRAAHQLLPDRRQRHRQTPASVIHLWSRRCARATSPLPTPAILFMAGS